MLASLIPRKGIGMHSVSDEINVVDRRVVESPELLGKECIGCLRVLAYGFYKRDASYRDGHRDLCLSCESAPRLSTDEHTHRLREMNESSEAVRRQQWEHQEDYQNDAARIGRPMHHSDLIAKLTRLVPSLYITEGNIKGDLAVFRVYPQPQPRLEGRSFEYLFYMPIGLMPEFSIYEFNERNIPVREKMRGWRTVLLRLIKSKLLTEDQCHEAFGRAEGPGAIVYLRKLYEFRNQKEL